MPSTKEDIESIISKKDFYFSQTPEAARKSELKAFGYKFAEMKRQGQNPNEVFFGLRSIYMRNYSWDCDIKNNQQVTSPPLKGKGRLGFMYRFVSCNSGVTIDSVQLKRASKEFSVKASKSNNFGFNLIHAFYKFRETRFSSISLDSVPDELPITTLSGFTLQVWDNFYQNNNYADKTVIDNLLDLKDNEKIIKVNSFDTVKIKLHELKYNKNTKNVQLKLKFKMPNYCKIRFVLKQNGKKFKYPKREPGRYLSWGNEINWNVDIDPKQRAYLEVYIKAWKPKFKKSYILREVKGE